MLTAVKNLTQNPKNDLNPARLGPTIGEVKAVDLSEFPSEFLLTVERRLTNPETTLEADFAIWQREQVKTKAE